MHPGAYSPSRATLALCLVPISIIAIGIAVLGVNIPYVDQLRFVSLIQHSREGTLTFAHLFAQNNENRPFFPRLLWLGLAALTRYDLRAELWANLLIAIATFVAFAAYTLRTWRRLGASPPALLLPLMAFTVFNWAQWESWLNSFQAVFFIGSACAIIGFILLAEGPTWLEFGAAVGLGIVGTFSTPNMFLYWPIGMVLILLRDSGWHRAVRAASWLVSAAASIALYMAGWHAPAGFGPAVLVTDMLQRAYWLTNFLGAPLLTLPDAAFVPGLLGLIVLGIAISSAARGGRLRHIAAYPAIALFVAGSGLLASLARLGLGTLQAVAPGYLTISAWYWAALLALTPLLPLPRSPRTVLYSLTVACLVWQTVWGLALAREYHLRLLRAYNAAVMGEPMTDDVLRNISRSEAFDIARDALDYLKQNRLSAYAHSRE